MKMNVIIKEVVFYVFFVVCLCIVSYFYWDLIFFVFREIMYNLFVVGVYGGKKNFLLVCSVGVLFSGMVI